MCAYDIQLYMWAIMYRCAIMHMCVQITIYELYAQFYICNYMYIKYAIIYIYTVID